MSLNDFILLKANHNVNIKLDIAEFYPSISEEILDPVCPAIHQSFGKGLPYNKTL